MKNLVLTAVLLIVSSVASANTLDCTVVDKPTVGLLVGVHSDESADLTVFDKNTQLGDTVELHKIRTVGNQTVMEDLSKVITLTLENKSGEDNVTVQFAVPANPQTFKSEKCTSAYPK